VHDGTGLSFWFRPLSAVLSEVPVDDRELPLLFHARTSDFQDVTVQLTLTYRFTDPSVATQRIDFSLDPDTGRWRGEPLAQVSGLLTESAQQHALDLLGHTALAGALVDGVSAVRERVADGLRADERLTETGLAVVDVRVVAIRPEPDVEKALQTTTREQMQQEADRATYERRARAVQRERAIGENELQNQIELARQEEQLVTQRGVNARRQAEEAAAASGIETEAQAVREQRLNQAKAEGVRALGDARAAAEAAHLAANRDIPEAVLFALAVKELANNLPKIDSLILTPDLLAPVLARLGGGTPS
jgi:regulator of protease activity HflC (stomatin/prohibitin superfamily)